MFGIFGKKENKAPVAPTASRPVVGSGGSTVDIVRLKDGEIVLATINYHP